MIVLDYPKTTKAEKPTIIVPPFHTGHLGFVPGTEVDVGLVTPTPGKHRPADSELVISPFSQHTGDMAVLTAVMRDDIGVVARLVRAVAELDINVETEESSSITHLREHSVTLVCDVSTLGERRPVDSTHHLRPYIHSDDSRLLQIVQHVLLHCADGLTWKDPTHTRLALDARMLAGHRISRNAPVRLARSKNFSVAIELPDRVAAGVLMAQTDSDAEDLDYMLISDTDDRSLRVYFLPAAAAAQVHHVGLVHADRPGALAALLKLIAASEFNILTSLVRKETVATSGKGRSIWEAVLQYRGDAADVSRARAHPHAPPLEWIRNQLAAAVTSVDEVAEFDIQVRAPSYPNTSPPTNSEVPASFPLITEARSPKRRAGREVAAPTVAELVSMRREAIRGRSDRTEREQLSNLLARIERSEHAPTIFLSYPMAARTHARFLRSALEAEGRFKVVAHDEKDNKPIVPTVVKKIIASDYFIGLWHHEDAEGGGYSMSPWMHFEYGIALANGKHSIVVHSDKLPEDLWKRVNTGISHPDYSDLSFVTTTIPMIVQHCRERFAHGGRSDETVEG
jgi:ACT domain-containing protein